MLKTRPGNICILTHLDLLHLFKNAFEQNIHSSKASQNNLPVQTFGFEKFQENFLRNNQHLLKDTDEDEKRNLMKYLHFQYKRKLKLKGGQ